MSHFTVLVFGDRSEVNGLLAPFDENIEMEKYEKETLSDGDRQSFLDYYIEKNPEEKGLSFEELYAKHGNDWNSNAWSNKDGEWKVYSTYNPDSKWDWYEIGGRWDKEIHNNCCLAKTVPADYTPFAFVTPDGKWHEKGEMGWWAIVSNEKEKDSWDKEFRAALSEYHGTVTLVDCHI